MQYRILQTQQDILSNFIVYSNYYRSDPTASGRGIKKRINYWLDIIGPKLEKHPLSYNYFIDQIELVRNFVFKSNFFIRELFIRNSELSLQMISVDKIRQIAPSKAITGEIGTSVNRLEEGYYVFKAFFKRCSIKQYRKFPNFLRFEVTCNHLPDIKIKKTLEHLPLVEEKCESILDRLGCRKSQ